MTSHLAHASRPHPLPARRQPCAPGGDGLSERGPRTAGSPSPALAAGLAVLAWLLALAASPVAADPVGGRWQWPVDPPHPVVHPFEQPEHRYAAGHRGLDIGVPGSPDGPGAAVRAVEAGTVRFAGEVAGRGVVSVLHADGLVSTYEPVQAVVMEGQRVAAGDLVGHVVPVRVGAQHCAEGACLHLGARQGDDYLDPLVLLGARGPSVLLPLDGGAAASAPAGRSHSGLPGSVSSGTSGAPQRVPQQAPLRKVRAVPAP